MQNVLRRRLGHNRIRFPLTWKKTSVMAGTAAIAALVSRWPFRSRELFSWDSANFALATEHIDIAAHRPHPPGYLGYVLVARAFNTQLHDVNLSLVVWNIVATAIAAVVIVFFACATSRDERLAKRTAFASALVLMTSPLLWFYGEVAEIYVSEMLVVLLVVFCSWQATRTSRGWLWCGAALACAVLFKVSSALLAVPCVLFGLSQIPRRARPAAAISVAALCVGGLLVLLAAAPGLPTIVWHQFITTTADSRLVGSVGRSASTSLAFNRNIRDTLLAALAMLGVGSLPGFVVWLARDRRLPDAISRGFAVTWFAPWLFLVTIIHIAKPGYILPLLPLAALILGGYYARQPAWLMTAFLGVQVILNVAQFTLLGPFPDPITGGAKPYRQKTFAEQRATDVAPVTEPTLATIRRSDAAVRSLRDTVTRTCPAGQPTIVADGSGIDWRRVMWYFPSAKAIRRDGGHFISAATSEEVVPVSDDLRFTGLCPVIWLAADPAPATLNVVRP